MTPVHKAAALRALADKTRERHGLLAVAWERLAADDLSDPAFCARWVSVLRTEAGCRGPVEADIIARAADILEGVTPAPESRPMFVTCSYPDTSPVTVYGVYATGREAREAASDDARAWVMDLVYPDGSRTPVAGDMLEVAKPEGRRMYGSIIAPKVSS